MKLGWVIAAVLLLGPKATVAPAQTPAQTPGRDAPDLRHAPPPGDSLVTPATVARGPRADSAQRYLWRSDFFHSPTSKLLRSVVIPGWGQWSNGKKQKAAIVVAIEGYFFTKAMIWRGRTLDRLHDWERTCDAGNCDNVVFNDYSSARDKRNYFYWLTGFTIFVSMFDAYADAYLLSMERTQDKPDDFWGGQANLYPDDEYRILATIKF